MINENDHIRNLEQDFITMHRILQDACKFNLSITKHRNKLWLECIDLRKQLKEKEKVNEQSS